MLEVISPLVGMLCGPPYIWCSRSAVRPNMKVGSSLQRRVECGAGLDSSPHCPTLHLVLQVVVQPQQSVVGSDDLRDQPSLLVTGDDQPAGRTRGQSVGLQGSQLTCTPASTQTRHAAEKSGSIFQELVCFD